MKQREIPSPAEKRILIGKLSLFCGCNHVPGVLLKASGRQKLRIGVIKEAKIL